MKAKLDVWTGLESFTRDDDLWSAISNHSRFNLQQMIDIAKDHDVGILFINLASNIKDFSPFKSEHLPVLTPEDTREFESLYQKGMRLAEEKGREALAIFERALRLGAEHADVNYRIGRCYLGLGDFAGAEQYLVRAKELDICPLRAQNDFNASVLETARRNGVPVVDFPSKLQKDSLARYGHAILGNGYFLDHVHPRIEVHQRLAEWILDALAEEGFIRIEMPLSPEQSQTLYDRFLADLDPSYYAQRDFNLGKVLGWAGKNEEAAEALQRASRGMQNDPMVHYNLGIVYQKLGKAEPAIARYQTVIRLTPEFAEAHFNMAKSYQMTGDFGAAAEAFQRVLELRPNDTKAHYNLALCYRELARFPEELTELEKARALDPELPEIASLLASVYLREGINYGKKGMLDEAIGVLARALELDTDSGTGMVHYHLGSLYAAHGQPVSAVQHFRKAKELGIDVPDEMIRELEAEAELENSTQRRKGAKPRK